MIRNVRNPSTKHLIIIPIATKNNAKPQRRLIHAFIESPKKDDITYYMLYHPFSCLSKG